jgi:hypothetical protein
MGGGRYGPTNPQKPSFSPIHLNTPGNVEAIGVSILCKDNQHIDFLSIYVPKANYETEEIKTLLNRINPYVVGGGISMATTRYGSPTPVKKSWQIHQRSLNQRPQRLPNHHTELLHTHQPNFPKKPQRST